MGHLVDIMANFQKPRPRPPKAKPASAVLSVDARNALAEDAIYIGSPHHTDVPKYGMQADPRAGAMPIEEAEEKGLKNPSCLVCPRKWVRRQKEATALIQKALKDGTFVSECENQKPYKLWVRDPEDANLVYEAKLTAPPNGYKAYPLTSHQVEFSLPFVMP